MKNPKILSIVLVAGGEGKICPDDNDQGQGCLPSHSGGGGVRCSSSIDFLRYNGEFATDGRLPSTSPPA